MYNIISLDCDGRFLESKLLVDKENLRFVIEFVEQLEKQELSLNEIQSLIRLMEAIRSMMGFMKFQETEKSDFNEILKNLLNRAVSMPPELHQINEVNEVRDASDASDAAGASDVPDVPDASTASEVPEVFETSPLHLSSNPSYDNNSPQEGDRDEDEVVPVIDNSLRWNEWRGIGQRIRSSSILKSVFKGLLYLLGITIVVFNVFILIALIQSADLPDKNPLCQPTASKGYHIRDWVNETSEKVRYQMWKFNRWLETRSNISVDSCPVCPVCPTCQTCPECPTCPKCPEVKKNAGACDLRAISDIVSFMKGSIV